MREISCSCINIISDCDVKINTGCASDQDSYSLYLHDLCKNTYYNYTCKYKGHLKVRVLEITMFAEFSHPTVTVITENSRSCGRYSAHISST